MIPDLLMDGIVFGGVEYAPPVSGKTFPVVETFGPTIQGEGPDAGLPCSFVRFGGCDYRCSWCDSLYAVEPSEVRKAERLDVQQIIGRLPDVPRVVLSGGNPALHELGELVDELHRLHRLVSVETQGSVWRDWLMKVDRLVISPKPPSSGMVSDRHDEQTAVFLEEAELHRAAAVKIVVFAERDYTWAQRFVGLGLPLYLSVGTPQPPDDFSVDDLASWDESIREEVCTGYRWLCEKVAGDPLMAHVRVLPQLHVLAWGTARGV